MSSVKITELPPITTIGSNTSNTIIVGVDIPTDITGVITLTTLSRNLYSNNNLYVGNTLIVLPNAVAQFSSNSDNYVQVNLQNERQNGSADIVITADIGTDENYYIDLGLNNSNYNFPGYTFAKPLDGYLVVQGNNTSPSSFGGNLIIGTTTVGKNVLFTQGSIDESGQVGGFLYNTGFKLFKKPIIFADNTTQNTAVDYTTINTRITANTNIINSSIASNVSILRSEITANAASANSVINTRITSNIATSNLFAQAAFNKANNALANTNGAIFNGNLNISGNVSVLGLMSSSTDSPIIFVDSGNTFSVNAAAFTYNNANSSVFIKNGIKTGYKLFPDTQTAISINITNDSVVRCNIISDISVTLSNFDLGKTVDLWITNTSGNQRTVTHGVSALNSTTGSISFPIPGTSSAHIKYYSLGSDLANTFVIINHN